MPNTRTITTIIGAGVAIWLLSRRKLIMQSQINFKTIRFEGSFINPKVIVVFSVYNPTNFSETINRVWGTITLNDNDKIGDVLQAMPITIKANSTVDYELPVDIKYFGLFESIKNAIAKKTGIYTFSGYAQIGFATIPLILTEEL